MVIGVIGCMAERDGQNIFERFPHVDILCGPGELDKLPALVHNASVTAIAKEDGGTKEDGEWRMEDGTADPPSSILHHRPAKQVALMGANVRRSGTLEAAQDNLELLDLS